MPNWVFNKIYCKPNALKHILNSNNDVDFSILIPEPERECDCPKEFIYNEDNHIQQLERKPWFNWYDWNIHNWGVKWNACDSELEHCEDYDIVSFSTAWGPPEQWIIKLESLGLPFIYYWEEEQGFGAYESFNGETSFSKDWDIPDYDEETGEWIDNEPEDYGLTEEMIKDFFKE